MGIEKLIPITFALALLAASSGQLPKIIRQIQKAELQLLRDSRPSQWGKLMTFR